jgi:hypothetical protein
MKDFVSRTLSISVGARILTQKLVDTTNGSGILLLDTDKRGVEATQTRIEK